MVDFALAALLSRRLDQVQRTDLAKSFGAASVRAVLASLPVDMAQLSASESPARPLLLARLEQLQALGMADMKQQLEEVLFSTLSQIR